MTAACHHVACITDDAKAVHSFLTDIVGLELHMAFRTSGEDMSLSAGWPENPGADVKMYGSPPTGIVEVIAIPEVLRGSVEPRIWLVSFATPNISATVGSIRRHGFDPSQPRRSKSPDVDFTMSVVEVGGVSWEFVTFGG